jgi:hypothetical protein
VISQTVVSQYKPYLERTANRIELLAQTVLILCMVVSSMYFTGEPTKDQARHSAAGVVFALLLCTLLMYLFAIMWAQCCLVPQQECEGEEQVEPESISVSVVDVELTQNMLSIASVVGVGSSAHQLSPGKGLQQYVADFDTEQEGIELGGHSDLEQQLGQAQSDLAISKEAAKQEQAAKDETLDSF